MSDRIDLLALHAQRLVGIPEWEPHKYETVDGGFLLTGAVGRKITKGPRKGWTTWKGCGRSTERRVVITKADHAAWCAAWEAETGNCAKCTGTGKTLRRWSRDNGHEYNPCPKCNGTGAHRTEAT